jgi:phytoene/squalene synthetase
MTLEACARLVERGDPDRWAALLAAPVAARAPLLPLYALNLELARAPWASREPLIAEMRLQWWRDVIEEAEPRAHEVAAPLHALLSGGLVPRGLLDAMAEARRWDIGAEPHAGEGALAAYLDATAGGLMWAGALALGAGPGAEGAVRALGRAAGRAAFLRALPELVVRGKRPLADTSPAALAAAARAGLADLARARAGRGAVRGLARAALLPGWQAGGLLAQAARDPAAVMEGRLALSDFARRGGLLWQALTGRF